MDIVRAVVAGLILVAAGYGVHLVLTWMGRRGWIFYGIQPTKPVGARSALALMEFETLFNPPIEHVLEYRRYGDLWVQETGEDDGHDRSDVPSHPSPG